MEPWGSLEALRSEPTGGQETRKETIMGGLGNMARTLSVLGGLKNPLISGHNGHEENQENGDVTHLPTLPVIEKVGATRVHRCESNSESISRTQTGITGVMIKIYARNQR
jgi:hypothetical protein